MNIPLIVYGENISYEYGGPEAVDTYSAKNQIRNTVAEPVEWSWWRERGITEEEFNMLK